MNHPAILGRSLIWAALMVLAVYTACFVVILIVNPPFTWTTWSAFASYSAAYPQCWKYVGMAMMLAFACFYAGITACAALTAPAERLVFARLAELFALAFAVCVSINYFVQLTATRLQLAAENSEGLLQFTQSYPISALNAIHMLGWTLFFSLSTLALALCLWPYKPVRWAALANSGMMVAGMIGYALNSYPLLLATMNLGLGATMLTLLLALLSYFSRSTPSR